MPAPLNCSAGPREMVDALSGIREGGRAQATRRGGSPDNTASPQRKRTPVKTYDIEVQRLKSLKHDKGLIEIGIDALVLPRAARDDQIPASSLRLPVEHARSLMMLLKQQLAELDKLQPRSRRSGRS